MRDCLDTRLDERDRQRLIELAGNLEALETKDIDEVMGIVACEG